MPDLTPAERLQPCLLDRLTDNDPGNATEGREQRVMSMQRYRQAVLRDLGWLLNASAHLPSEGLDEFDQIPSSVLNFGIPDVAGMHAGSPEAGDLEQRVLEALRRFEPRISGSSLSVRAAADAGAAEHRALHFEIRGDLWAEPVPEAMLIKTEMDLETGECRLAHGSHG